MELDWNRTARLNTFQEERQKENKVFFVQYYLINNKRN